MSCHIEQTMTQGNENWSSLWYYAENIQEMRRSKYTRFDQFIISLIDLCVSVKASNWHTKYSYMRSTLDTGVWYHALVSVKMINTFCI